MGIPMIPVSSIRSLEAGYEVLGFSSLGDNDLDPRHLRGACPVGSIQTRQTHADWIGEKDAIAVVEGFRDPNPYP